MSCAEGSGIAICGSWGNPNRHRIIYCPVCKHRRRFLEHWGGAWYGPTVTCMTCGDAWTDGEMHERPFQPRWRRKSVEAAKAKPVLSPAEYDAFIHRELESIMDFEQRVSDQNQED